MGPDAARSNARTSWVNITGLDTVYSFEEKFRVVQAELQYRRFDGSMSSFITRINFERGDSVGVLLYDPNDDAVVLARQFRYPVYAGLNSEERIGDGARKAWTLEIVAGMVDEGKSVIEVANKELLEEVGYVASGILQPILTIYPSPGGTSERILLCIAEVDHRQGTAGGGGVKEEGEDIEVVVIPFQKALQEVASGEIFDAKTIIALQHLALLKTGGDESI